MTHDLNDHNKIFIMKYTVENNILTIQLPERIDTAVSTQVASEINEICETPHEAVILDADSMKFISSSGLRVVLCLAKREKDFQIINVCNDVYNVFEMTGFLRIMHVERALRQVSIEGCPEIGRGGVGTVYRYTPETIIKVFREGTSFDTVRAEIAISKEAFVLGMPTAISFETVKVGNQYGLVHELLDAKTLAAVINDDRENAEKYGHQFGQLMRNNHDIIVNNSNIPDAYEATMKQIEHIRRYFSDEAIDILKRIYNAIPRGNRLLHCDLHPKNVMVVNGELILIDMGEVCCGNPLEDLSHSYSSMIGLVGDYQSIIGMPEEVSHRVFNSAMQTYFGTTDSAVLAHKMDQIRVASYVRNFTWLSLSDSFPEAIIDTCRQVMKERVLSHVEDIDKVLATFDEWKDL